MDTTQLLKGVLDVAVLAVVEDEDGYGYDVLRRLRAGGLSEVGDASVYGTFRRLYAAGALTSYVVPSDEGPHRKYYGITPAGPRPARHPDQGLGEVRGHRDRAPVRHPCRHRARGSPLVTQPTAPPSAPRSPSSSPGCARSCADLAEDEREELLDGLEADLSEQVAAGDRLPDPAAYAVELRAAAGVTASRRPAPAGGVAPPRRGARPAPGRSGALDVARRTTRRVWSVVEALRPAWWVLRAWVAVTLLDQLAGHGSTSRSGPPSASRSSARSSCSPRSWSAC